MEECFRAAAVKEDPKKQFSSIGGTAKDDTEYDMREAKCGWIYPPGLSSPAPDLKKCYLFLWNASTISKKLESYFVDMCAKARIKSSNSAITWHSDVAPFAAVIDTRFICHGSGVRVARSV